jgi:beta-glucanase (GH16 family)
METEPFGHPSRAKSPPARRAAGLRRAVARRVGVAALFAACGCGSAADLSIGSQEETGGPQPDPWRLLWRDDFRSLDPTRWQISTHTFAENYADFMVENATLNAGVLELRVSEKPAGSMGKPYAAAEVRTVEEFTHGKFLTSARFANASGVTSTMFLFYDWFLHEPDSLHWNEIVMESSGTSRLYYTYTLQNLANADGRERFVTPGDLPFDITADFHVYGCEWSPAGVNFTVDGSVFHSISGDIANMLLLPKRFVMSAYPSTRVELEGPFDAAALPVVAFYDWVAVYAYVGTGGVDAGAD